MELDLASVWSTWVDAHDGDGEAALGHVLLVLDGQGLFDDARGAA